MSISHRGVPFCWIIKIKWLWPRFYFWEFYFPLILSTTLSHLFLFFLCFIQSRQPVVVVGQSRQTPKINIISVIGVCEKPHPTTSIPPPLFTIAKCFYGCCYWRIWRETTDRRCDDKLTDAKMNRPLKLSRLSAASLLQKFSLFAVWKVNKPLRRQE